MALGKKKGSDEEEALGRSRRLHRGARLGFSLAVLYALTRLSCDAMEYAQYVASLAENGQQQGMAEQTWRGQSQLEEQLRRSGPVELDSNDTIADFLREGQSPQDLGNYMDFSKRHPQSGRRPQDLDAEALLLAAKELRFEIDPQKSDPGADATKKGGPKKFLSEEEDVETGHRFELRRAEGNDTLVFNRDTSFIVPRGKLDYGSSSSDTKEERELEIAREVRALIMVDTSGSMCSNASNFDRRTFKGQSYTIYLPSAFALAIADYYIHGLHTSVSGFTFSDQSDSTPFTTNMGTLAYHFARQQCGGTYIDYQLMARIAKGSNTALDIYVIADSDIFSDRDMRQNIDQIKTALGNEAALRRIFFIEWRTSDQGYNPSKDRIIRDTGIGNAYYTKITGLDDMEAVVKLLKDKVKG